jgi:hypothetical protein
MTTQTVVTDKHNTVVSEKLQTQVVVQIDQPHVIVTGMMGPGGVSSLQGLQDVDLTNLINGALLVYNTSNQKWTATNLLEQQIVESGQY